LLWVTLRTHEMQRPEDRAGQAINFAYLEQVYEKQHDFNQAAKSLAGALQILKESVRECPDPPNDAVVVTTNLTIVQILSPSCFLISQGWHTW
jgi:hypothetical protein